jgi:tRNA (cmo5U34)-methyltransferase
VDNSEEMLKRCRQKLAQSALQHEHELICADLNQGVAVQNASMVLMVLTLQFVRPLYRDALVKRIFGGLNENGCLILVEKVLGEDSVFNRLFINYYYDLKKRHGYSEMEIAKKREALENVLVPYKLMENREMLLRAGFRYCDVFFKWYNFCGIIALK